MENGGIYNYMPITNMYDFILILGGSFKRTFFQMKMFRSH